MILTRILRTQLVAINLGISARLSQVDPMLDWHHTLALLYYIVFCIDVLELHYTFPLDSMNELKEVFTKKKIKKKTHKSKHIKSINRTIFHTKSLKFTKCHKENANHWDDEQFLWCKSCHCQFDVCHFLQYFQYRESNVQFHCAFLFVPYQWISIELMKMR